MRCLPMLRATLALAAFSPLHPCFAEMPEVVDSERTAAVLPSRTVNDQTLGSAASETVIPNSVDLPVGPKAISLNIVDHKLALSLAVDTWGQISAMEAALPSIKHEALRRDITVRLEHSEYSWLNLRP